MKIGTANNALKIYFPKGRYCLFLFFLLWNSLSFSQVSATLDTLSIKIGEEIKYRIQVAVDSSATVNFPEGQSFLPLEVIEVYNTDTVFEQQKMMLIKKYGLTQFDSGRYVIPQQLIRINEQVFFTDTLVVEVADVVVDTLKQGMYTIKPHLDVAPVKGRWIEALLWILLILALIALVVYLFLRRKRKIKEAKKVLPPFEEALVALQTLDNSLYLKENNIKDYYSVLTEIVKRYLDREVDEAALESTTDELITKLELHKDSGNLDFDKETIYKLSVILNRADLIKFAKMQTESGQAQLDRSEIEDIIKVTHEAIPEPTEEELQKNAEYQEMQLKKKKARKNKLIFGSIAGILVFALIISTLIFGADTIKNTLLGNYTKKLAEKEWIKSDYGSPAVIITTPEVLVRADGNEEVIISTNPDDIFTFGDIQKKLFIYVGSSKADNPEQINLEAILQEKLALLEQSGATNLMIMTEPFETEKNVSGIKAAGEFNIKIGDNKYKKSKSEYQLIVFAQQGAVQEILLVNEKEDIYAQQIKERILKSIEIEVLDK